MDSFLEEKALIEYLPVVSFPPGDNICKWCLEKMTEMIDDLQSESIFLHVDEAVYCLLLG